MLALPTFVVLLIRKGLVKDVVTTNTKNDSIFTSFGDELLAVSFFAISLTVGTLCQREKNKLRANTKKW